MFDISSNLSDKNTVQRKVFSKIFPNIIIKLFQNDVRFIQNSTESGKKKEANRNC
jgi:hypothetical protein